MPSGLKNRRWEIAVHVLIWAVILLLPYLLSSAGQGYSIGGVPGSFFSISGCIHAAIFYSNAFLLYPKLARGWRWWLYIPASALLIIISFVAKYQIIARFYPGALDSESARFVFAPSFFVFLASFIYRRILDNLRKEKEQKERHAQQLAAELKFLRSQINPHFLFNVLTNMVSLARQKSDRLENALIRLSDLMRYMLYETGDAKVPVRKELEYLNSYVDLQKLRFEDSINIEFTTRLDETADTSEIEPMLLIPFVENAFKHGTGWVEDPFIRIDLAISNGRLILEVTNPFERERKEQKDDHSGIGLENVQARLRLLYPASHLLRIDKENDVFQVILNLKLI